MKKDEGTLRIVMTYGTVREISSRETLAYESFLVEKKKSR